LVKRVIVDLNTGEEVNTLNDGDRIVRKKSIDSLKSIQVWNIKHFYKGNINEIRKQLEALSVYEKAFLFAIVHMLVIKIVASNTTMETVWDLRIL